MKTLVKALLTVTLLTTYASAGTIDLWTFADGSRVPDPHHGSDLLQGGAVTMVTGGDQGGDNYLLNIAKGQSIRITVIPLENLSGFTLDYYAKTALSGQAATTIQWGYYTTDANQVTWWGSPVEVGTAWAPLTVDFSEIALSGNPTSLTFQGKVSVAGSGSGAVSFDTVDLQVVPEPVNVALAAFGLCVVGVGAGRRYLRSKGNP